MTKVEGFSPQRGLAQIILYNLRYRRFRPSDQVGDFEGEVEERRVCVCLVDCAEPMELGAILFEPVSGLLHLRHGIAYEAPEAGSVVHLPQMGGFVSGDIVEHEARREDQAPGEADRAGGRAGAPAGALVAHGDAFDLAAEIGGVIVRPAGQLGLGLSAQPVGQAAWAVLFAPRNTNARKNPRIDRFAVRTVMLGAAGGLSIPEICRLYHVGFLDPYHALIAYRADEADFMRKAAKRDDGAVRERNGLGETVDLAFQPVHMPGEELTGFLEFDFLRQCQYGGAFSVADLKGKTAGSARTSQLYRTVNTNEFDLESGIRRLSLRE